MKSDRATSAVHNAVLAIVMLFAATVSIRTLPAQTQPQDQPTSLQKLLEQKGTGGTIPEGLLPPMEESIDEEDYIVGPNDVFSFSMPGMTTVPVQIVVSPEGSLIVPTGGEFHVSGKSLKKVKEEVRGLFRTVKPSLALFSPRRVVVTVLGAVHKPGAYAAHAVLRVDKAIAMANASAPGPVTHSTRRILLRRKGSEDRTVDLDRYLAFRNGEDNPLLREGDVIIVPPRSANLGSVSVFGAVHAPGQYEFREGDSLTTLIRIAQGLTANAETSRVEIARLTEDGGTLASRTIDLASILSGTSPDIPLKAGERIVIPETVDRRRDYKVHVRGEVVHPGTYPITPDSTTLTEIIARAGGFTARADLSLAEVERRLLSPQGQAIDIAKEMLMNVRMNDLLVTPEERSYYELEAGLRRGTVAVNFAELFGNRPGAKDVFLQDGDVIFVPGSARSVYVYGQVGRPGYVPFKEGADVRYYIEQAGGFGQEADAGETRIIKGKTREWLDPSDTTIEAGDYVWVPKDIRYPTAYYLNLISQAASFISVVLSMTVIILQITSN